MALYFCKNYLTAGDYLRTTRQYSSAQSLSRASKNGRQRVHFIGGLSFVAGNSADIAALHGISSWEGLNVIETLPEGLDTLSRISKKVGVGEAVMLGWAMFNRMDVYWVGGHFAARLEPASQIAKHEKQRKATFTKPARPRRKGTYL